ncbi:NAD-dependent epimerase/dehydratase family protein [Nocardia sp. NPDC004568]|uniref:NAD-dependent epimerase/dehydratase family protein n=1 Tax=Nocardia sp. NPDC004568 TaxID=3154551 RepID=UPI0033B690F8
MTRTEVSFGGQTTRVADLLDGVELRKALEGVDAVCHLAGLTRARESLDQPLRYFQVNTAGTLTLLSAMDAVAVPHIVFASTGAIYGSPDHQPMTEDTADAPPHPYAASKMAAELALFAQARTGRLSATVLRLMNVAGGADTDSSRLIPRTIAAAADDSVLEVNGDGRAVRDYLHIEDAAAAFVACFDRMPQQGEARRYIIGSGRGTSVLEVVAAIEERTGRQIRLLHKPPAPEPSTLISDPTRARNELLWYPVCSGIREIIRDSLSVSPRGGENFG